MVVLLTKKTQIKNHSLGMWYNPDIQQHVVIIQSPMTFPIIELVDKLDPFQFSNKKNIRSRYPISGPECCCIHRFGEHVSGQGRTWMAISAKISCAWACDIITRLGDDRDITCGFWNSN
jgi:hypothetical protein